MTCLDDAAAGDASQEGKHCFSWKEILDIHREIDVDPRFLQTLQTAQYTIQYLIGCQNLLTQRAELIENAMKVFETEEDELDLQIAKMRLFNSLFPSHTSQSEE